MLEKDIENLIESHPEEFLPHKQIRLIGRQMQLGGSRADLVYQNGPKSKLVIEIKRGLLMREAIGQIAAYYGLLRQSYPAEDIQLMFVANVIPRELAIFMKETMGIQSLEIPVSQIRNVAKKYSYQFEDELTSEQKIVSRDTLKTLDPVARRCHVWIFQANPQRYDILNALADQRIDEDVWLVSQHKDEIKKNDIGLIWMSGNEAGIYAVMDITSDPQFLVDSLLTTQYWISESDKQQTRLRIKYTYRIKFPDNPIYKHQLKNIPELRNLSILNCARGTNFPVRDNEWKIISDIIMKRI